MAKIIIDRNTCNQDGICVEECPALVLRINPEDGYPEVTEDFEEICLRCGHCVAVCPSAAFSLDWLTPEACLPIRPEWTLSKGQAEQFLRSRRSIRVFKRERVPRDQLEKLIEIGCTAPSAKNMQPWQWIVIQDPKEVDRLDAMIIDWMRFLIKADLQAAENLKLPRIVRLWDKGLYKALRNAPHCCRPCGLLLGLWGRGHGLGPELRGALSTVIGIGGHLVRLFLQGLQHLSAPARRPCLFPRAGRS